jgi:hypothetical protein
MAQSLSTRSASAAFPGWVVALACSAETDPQNGRRVHLESFIVVQHDPALGAADMDPLWEVASM